MDIRGHAALVTGGGSGLGAATARMLAQAGAKVALLDVNQKVAAETAIDINGIAIHCDVTDSASTEAAIAKAAADHGPARILINCAGIGTAKRIVGRDGPMPLADFDRVMRVNLIGTFNAMRLAAAAMAKLDPLTDDERGIIVCTASVAAYDGPDRPGRLRLVEGRRGRPRAAGGARIRPVRHSRQRYRARHLRHADAAGPLRAGAGTASRLRCRSRKSSATRRSSPRWRAI